MKPQLDINYVYIIGHRMADAYDGPVKVGFSRYPEKRLASLQTGNPRSIGFVFNFKAPSRDSAMQAEAAFHYVAREYRLSGEWFDMAPEFALNTLTKIFMAVIMEDIVDPATIALLCDFSGVWDAVNVCGDMQEVANV